jgi:nucleotide-binding universal stress UspA family protein
MTIEIQKILYATDLSPNSAHAFQYATEFAEQNKAELVILHVLEMMPKHARAYFETFMDRKKENELSRQKIAETIEKISNRLRVFCEKVFSGDPACEYQVASIEVCEGYPAEEILRKANELACDMIVMGAHGKGILSYTFLGSVAEKVLRRARRPVCIIPLPKEETELTVHEI